MGTTGRTRAEYEALIEDRKNVAALGRVGSVDDISALALFLASDEGSFITNRSFPAMVDE
jgi:NAD(P)-dependent dehydrogenase (short-subunit alcohol dehydrogenase family)